MPLWSTLFLPPTILVAGAIVLWLARRYLPDRPPLTLWLHDALPLAFLLAAALAWITHPPDASPFRLLVLPPGLGIDVALSARLDAWGRLFGLLLLWSALLAAWPTPREGRSGQDAARPFPQPASAWLILAAALLVLFAADWPTLATTLLLVDLVYLTVAPTPNGRAFIANALGCLGLLAATFILATDTLNLSLTADQSLPATAKLLVIAASLIRLAPYPLHFWLTDAAETAAPPEWPLQLISPGLGLYLLTRLSPRLIGPIPLPAAIQIIGMAGALLVSLLAWHSAQRHPRRAISLIELYQLNLALSSWVFTRQPSTGFWMACNLALGATASTTHCIWLSAAGDGRLAWRDRLPGGVGVASLAGLPLTVGFLVRLPLYRALLDGGQAGWLALTLLAESLTIAALLRLWNGQGRSDQPQITARPWSVWGAASLQTAPLLLLGLFPSLATRLADVSPGHAALQSLSTIGSLTSGGIGLWAALLLPLAMGYGLYRSQMPWPVEWADRAARLATLFQLDWLHRAVGRFLDQTRQAVWSMGALLHGEGYLAWVAFSIVLLFVLILNR
ncbi:MAG: hypothetical protein ACOYZ7_00600 [Chloroflexota bacterium]